MLERQFNDFLNQNFDKAISSGVALAVSGGADSIALLYLASKWAKENDIRLIVLSVDHKLREESVSELEFVKEEAQRLGHECIRLIWRHDGQKSSIQERARKARYDMMTKKCHELSIRTLLTAHHYDDSLENYLMRKSKKSGVLGLSSQYSAFFDNIQILRPFYNFEKDDLIKYLTSNSINWIEDKSNSSDLYERNRIRKQITSYLPEEKKSLQEELSIVNQKAETLNVEFIEAIAENVKFYNFGFALINLNSYAKINYEIAVYLINFVLTSVSGKLDAPRYRSVEKLLGKVRSGDEFDCTLNGCVLRRIKDNILIFREKSDVAKKEVFLDNAIIWDNRFRFDINNILVREYKIERLVMEDYVKIKEELDLQKLANLSNNNHKDILFTLPVIKNLEKIVAIPHISYYDDFEADSRVDIIFRPGFVSRFTHFL